jgi:hypothetical protein
MIFDRLWRAERRAAKEDKRIHDHYEPLMEAAEKAKDDQGYASALSALLYETDLNDEPELIRTERLVREARKLGIPLPAKPDRQDAERIADPNWVFNSHNGNWYFSENKELELRKQVREESDARFAHFWDRFGGFLSALTFVVLLANAFILWRQEKIMSTQADIMQQTLPMVGKQAEAATSAANTAGETLNSSIQSFKQEERAYVATTNAVMANPPLCNIPPVKDRVRVCVDVHCANSGRTPAIGIRLHRYATFGRDSEEVIRSMKVPAYKSPDGSMLGNVGEQWGTAPTDPADRDTANKLVNAEMPVYIYGIIQYFDVFGEYHETGYCYQRVLHGTAFIACDFGNWFDIRPTYDKQER